MKFDYYWPGIKKDIEEVIKKCQIFNRKKTGGCDFVSTRSYLEKVALDIIEFRDVGKYVLVSIDYHTRMVWGTVLEDKRASSVVGFLRHLSRKGRKPSELITDNGKEFANDELREFCNRLDISHRRIGSRPSPRP